MELCEEDEIAKHHMSKPIYERGTIQQIISKSGISDPSIHKWVDSGYVSSSNKSNRLNFILSNRDVFKTSGLLKEARLLL